jgi:hypothetical protein
MEIFMKLFELFDLEEKFSDLGKLSPDDLVKGQKLAPETEGNFKKVPGRIFKKIVTKFADYDKMRDTPKGLEDLSIYETSEYEKMDCYIGDNNSSGYCIKDGDELVSVFSIAKSSGKAIVADAVRNGAKRLDCFATRNPDGSISGHLYSLYSWGGFKIDKSLNSGTKGKPYAIINGVSDFVDDQGNVQPENPNVVIFMKK